MIRLKGMGSAEARLGPAPVPHTVPWARLGKSGSPQPEETDLDLSLSSFSLLSLSN
ncbi:hypothetical protein Hanom_Chr16g01447681 [Helianthus anomalus]